MKRLLALVPLAFLAMGADRTPTADAPQGKLGYARFIIKAKDYLSLSLSARSEIADTQGDTLEILSPIDDLEQLDGLASQSHAATEFCGSMDYYPLGYTLAPDVTHKMPYFAPEAHFTALETVLNDVSVSNMRTTIDTLAALPTRFHRSTNAADAPNTVEQLWTGLINGDAAWSISQYTHTNTTQKSVIAKLPGENTETIVFGAHLDSINASRVNNDSAAPGADDDASGIAILTEMIRLIQAHHMKFHRSLEFQGYAAEEVGLVGSREIAAAYQAQNVPVDAMLQFDMAYYGSVADQGVMFFLEDFTTLDLTRSGIQWTKDYLKGAYQRGAMPKGAASDHKGWWEQGYATLFPFENALADNPFIHSPSDTADKFDDGSRIERMAKFGLIFLAYEAGLVSLDADYQAELTRLASASKSVSAELFFAVRKSESGTQDFAVSAPESASFLEFCPADTAADLRCVGTRQRLTASEVRDGRRVFFTNAAGFNAEEKWRVEAYDAEDNLLARRNLTWATP